MSQFDKLQVKDIVQETHDTISIHFNIPEEYRNRYSFKAGQYLTLKADIAGEDIRRAYSICTPPFAKSPAVTVKRVKGGRMSNYLHDQLKAGDEIEVMAPDGRFTVLPDPDLARDHYFFAAGSGITPIISMIRELLEHEPKSNCHLLYGSRSENAIIFDKTIAELMQQHEGQLHVSHTISQPTKEKAKGIKGLLGGKTISWTGSVGRVDADKLDEFLEQYKSYNDTQLYYICGPGNMIDRLSLMLREKGISKEYIKAESFGGGSSSDANASNGAAPTAVTDSTIHIKLGSQELSFKSDGEKYILDTILDAGKEAPYSCTSGACSTCIAKVTEGKAVMDQCYALDDDEVEEGFILTCQAKPASKVLKVDFNV